LNHAYLYGHTISKGLINHLKKKENLILQMILVEFIWL